MTAAIAESMPLFEAVPGIAPVANFRAEGMSSTPAAQIQRAYIYACQCKRS